MFKQFRDKITVSGIAVLMVGVALLVFTFISAYGFLTQSLSIIASEDLVRTFGEALAPLIATCIRVMYLGVMGWIGSLLTVRGVTMISNLQRVPKTVVEKPVVAKPKPQLQKERAEKPREEEEAKQSEQEIVVIPPEQVAQAQPEQKQPDKKGS